MARAAKIVFIASFAFLNLYLAWASFMLRAISRPLYDDFNHVIRSSDIAVWKDLHLVRVTYYTQVVADVEALALLVLVVWSAGRLSPGSSRAATAIRRLQVTAACFVILGTEVALFDYQEFFLHFTDAVLVVDASWFTNADLLLGSVALLGATFLLRGRLSKPGTGRKVAVILAVAIVVSVLAVGYLLLPVTSTTTTTAVFAPSGEQVGLFSALFPGLLSESPR